MRKAPQGVSERGVFQDLQGGQGDWSCESEGGGGGDEIRAVVSARS